MSVYIVQSFKPYFTLTQTHIWWKFNFHEKHFFSCYSHGRIRDSKKYKIGLCTGQKIAMTRLFKGKFNKGVTRV